MRKNRAKKARREKRQRNQEKRREERGERKRQTIITAGEIDTSARIIFLLLDKMTLCDPSSRS